MRGFLKLWFPLAAALAALTLFCGHAKADTDEQAFLDAVRAAGFDKPDNVALRDGYLLCAADSQNGVSDDLIGKAIDAAQQILGTPPTDPVLEEKFQAAAEQYLCPSTIEDTGQ